MADSFTAFEIITDRNGKEHKIYSAMMAWKDDLRHLATKFSDMNIFSNFFNVKIEDGQPVFGEDGFPEYDDTAFDAILEIIYLALNKKETKEQIMEWLDIKLTREIYEIFCDISGYKKKQTAA